MFISLCWCWCRIFIQFSKINVQSSGGVSELRPVSLCCETNDNIQIGLAWPIYAWQLIYLLTLSGPSFQINVKSRDWLGTSYIKYELFYMLCRPHSNIYYYVRADRRTITRNTKWPVKYCQNTARKLHVGQNASTFFSIPKMKSVTKFKYI